MQQMMPREHGAYVELFAPLLVALTVGHANLAGALLACAAIATFVAHESLLVVLGWRGSRVQRERGAVAWR